MYTAGNRYGRLVLQEKTEKDKAAMWYGGVYVIVVKQHL